MNFDIHPVHQSTWPKILVSWQQKHGRHHLPWQQNHTPYHIWISEIMLQQTQVNTVIPYYTQFVQKYPTIFALHQAPLEHVLRHWSGLGYYRRAHYIKQTAAIITTQHKGIWPTNLPDLQALPGIGRSTAGAILSLALNLPYSILDGNVKRVLSRLEATQINFNKLSVQKHYFNLLNNLIPHKKAQIFNQALMDMGAKCCTRSKPLCYDCPLNHHCYAHKQQQTHLYPQKKIAPNVKKITKTLFLLVNNQHLLLYQRPIKGIWSKLHSLPEFSSEQELYHALNINPQSISAKWQHTTTIHHRLTHRLLSLKIMRCNHKIKLANPPPPFAWFHLHHPPPSLPAPLRTLWRQLQQEYAH